jgi:hypothetical protein
LNESPWCEQSENAPFRASMSHINLHTGRGLENIILSKLALDGGCKVKMAQSRVGHSGSKEKVGYAGGKDRISDWADTKDYCF